MRFRANITNISTFTKFTASLATLGHIAWVRLDSNDIRFTVIPERGSQVWSVLTPDTIFETYTIQSASEDNVINLEVPLAPLQRALKSAANASAANVRLTKKDGVPLLSITITTVTINSSAGSGRNGFLEDAAANANPDEAPFNNFFGNGAQDRETTVTQDIPVRVLAPASVEGLHQPLCRDPDVHLTLPNLQQLKSISDRFTKLSESTKSSARSASAPKLELSANMHGCLRLGLNTDSLHITSLWTGLENPELDPNHVTDIEAHPSTRMKALGDASGQSGVGWATVRVEGRDWGRVLSVGRLGGRVVACFCHEHAMVLYVYLEGESVLTYYISSYSA